LLGTTTFCNDFVLPSEN